MKKEKKASAPYVMATRVSLATGLLGNTGAEGNRAAFGITDGKLWFFYAYVSERAADKVLLGIGSDPEKVRVNISQASPVKIVGEG